MKKQSELQRPPQAAFPASSTEMREIALRAAGFDTDAVGEFVRAGVKKLVEKLAATKTQYFAFEGVVTDQRTDEDTPAQLKAAAELVQIGIDVMGMKQRAASPDSHPSPNVTIDLSGWTVQPPTKDTPTP